MAYVVALLLSTVWFAVLAVDVGSGVTGSLDTTTREFVISSTDETLRYAARSLSNVPLVVLAGLNAWSGSRALSSAAAPAARAPLLACLAVLLAGFVLPPSDGWVGDGGLLLVLKEVFGRPRPSELALSALAFPSGHTAAAAYLGLCFALITSPLANAGGEGKARAATPSVTSLVAACVAIALTGLLRVVADVHWATDVLAGAAYGVDLALAAAALAALLKPVADTAERVKAEDDSPGGK